MLLFSILLIGIIAVGILYAAALVAGLVVTVAAFLFLGILYLVSWVSQKLNPAPPTGAGLPGQSSDDFIGVSVAPTAQNTAAR